MDQAEKLLNSQTCPICRRYKFGETVDQGYQLLTCEHCGQYRMTFEGVREWARMKWEADFPYLSVHTRQVSERGNAALILPTNWKELAAKQKTTPVSVKIDRLIRYFANRSMVPGDTVALWDFDYPLIGVVRWEEAVFLVEAIHSQGLFDRKPPEALGYARLDARGNRIPPSAAGVVTPAGWAYVAATDPGGKPGTCFVAMAFDPSLTEAYEQGIQKAIEAAGLTSIRVDRLEHNEFVNDVIFAEIRRAQVTIADVTLQRVGVYFEAGFALGLGRTVIWTCREDDIPNVHFDTRQYSHVVWKTPAELATKLEARIRGTVTIPVK